MSKLKGISYWANSALTVFVFLAGAAFGTYYSEDITSRLFNNADQPSASINIPKQEVHSSTLIMDQLESPLLLVYSDTFEESTLQEYLKEGAVILPLGTSLGEPGNVVITAHSSGTTSFGQYRFAFSKLGKLEIGDEFSVITPKATYSYKVYGTEIVWPHQVDKLPKDDRSTVTLVTCWPLWTNFKRLLVNSELINVEYNV